MRRMEKMKRRTRRNWQRWQHSARLRRQPPKSCSRLSRRVANPCQVHVA